VSFHPFQCKIYVLYKVVTFSDVVSIGISPSKAIDQFLWKFYLHQSTLLNMQPSRWLILLGATNSPGTRECRMWVVWHVLLGVILDRRNDRNKSESQLFITLPCNPFPGVLFSILWCSQIWLQVREQSKKI
jgi:hypothetical protein